MRGQAAITPMPLVAVVVTILLVVTGGTVVEAIDTGAMQHEYDKAEAYCDQELGEGNYDLVQVNAVWGGGLHCHGEDGEVIHLHKVPTEAEEAALEAQEAES